MEGWWGAGIAAGLGVGGALVQLAACYRPPVREERRRDDAHRVPAPGAPTAAPRRLRPMHVVLGVVCALLAVLWVYAFFIADPQGEPTRGPGLGGGAQKRSARTPRPAGRLPDPRSLAGVEPLALRQRAEIGEDATDLLIEMVDGLAALPPPSGPDDAELVSLWLTDWRTQIEDRQPTSLWRAGEDVLPGDRLQRRPLGIRISDFTTLNAIDSCAPPGDFG